MRKKLRVGVIGYGRMGRGFVAAMQQSEYWEIAVICDVNPASCELAAKTVPGARITRDADTVFDDPSIDAVGLFTLADARPAQILKALAAHKHVMAEKPIAADARRQIVSIFSKFLFTSRLTD